MLYLSQINIGGDEKHMAIGNLNRFNFVLPDALATEIDKYRKDVGTLPPKAVAVRQLIKLGLEAYWKNTKDSPSRRD